MRMTITLTEPERQALTEISEIEVRDPRDQIRYWLRQDAYRRGLLSNELGHKDSAPQTMKSQGEDS